MLLRGLTQQLRRHALIALAAIAVMGAAFLGLAAPFDQAMAGARFKLLSREPSDRVTVVEIDPRSLAAAPQWPWARSRFARAINNLHAAGATLVAFDVDFSAASSEDQDRSLAAAIDAAPAAVVLPTFVQRAGGYRNRPLQQLARNALIADVNVQIDPDGRVRRYQMGRTDDQGYMQSMGALLANAPYGDESGFSIDYGIRADHIARLSFEDVFNNRFDPRLVAGRSILIGSTASELGDEFATPIAPSMPGMYVHTLAFESIVQNRMLRSVAPFLSALLGLLALLLLWPKSGRRGQRIWLWHCCAVAGGLIVPLLLQALTPVSLDVGVIFLAQGLAFWRAVQCELDRRAEALVRQREASLMEAARQDSETALPNRRAMLEALSALGRDPDGAGIIALAVGVDQFTAMRGAIGHAKANDLMRSLAALLQARCDRAQVFHISTSILGVAALGGDAELAAMLHDLNADADLDLSVGDHQIAVPLRVGAALMHNPQATPEEVLERAVVALDYARTNKKRVLRYSDSFPDPKKFLALLADMSRGIERGEFHVMYQPKAHARDGDIVGAEALLRWAHPIDGPLPPHLFIGMAEETGAIDILTLWALKQVIEDQRRMRAAGVKMTISVNISGKTLGDTSFCEAAIALIRASKADICFEITETAVIGNPEAAVQSITAMRNAGIRISIDDYGAGLSSLSYLKRIAADELKIDRSLIEELLTTSRDRLIVKSTIDLAHALGMCVIAEGVESEATLALLASMGCDCVQGYLIGRPLPLDELIAGAAASGPETNAAHA